MTYLEAIILGVVEGLTEFIPVSSTGHLLLTTTAMGMKGDAVEAYVIVIQLGALLAVALHYRARIMGAVAGLTKPGSSGFRLTANLLIAFFPAAVAGLLLRHKIHDIMGNDLWIAGALIVGGIVMIVAEKALPESRRHVDNLDAITWKDALCVGLAQCFSLWPGMSRSMTTIVGGQLRGLSNPVAADFSFLLALPTLGAATVYEAIKSREALANMDGGGALLGIGLLVSFATGWAAVAWFLKVLKKVGMTPFGIYRIVIGGVVVALLLAKG